MAIGTVVKVVIGLIVIALALFFFTGIQNLWLPLPCEGYDDGLALSSVEALRCAVDFVVTQPSGVLSVASCNGGEIRSGSGIESAKQQAEEAAAALLGGRQTQGGCQF